ncbi:MAG: TIGR04222 domain-containing membrane protein [Erythrobacter sp.]
MQLFASWTGSEFLIFYIALLGLSTLASWWIPMHLRLAGRRSESLDAESLALLVGGRERFADVLLADLYVRGGLAVTGAGTLVVVNPRLPTTPAGSAVLAADGPLTFGQVRGMLDVHAARLAARLQRGGLLLRPSEIARLRWLSVVPFVVVLMVGFYRERAGSALGEPTGCLIVLMVVTAIVALLRFFIVDRRTRAGIAEVARQQAACTRLAGGLRAGEVPMAVALFGTGVLISTPWEPVHALRQQGSSSDSSGGDSSSDSGGGDGGGGCGGCGD